MTTCLAPVVHRTTEAVMSGTPSIRISQHQHRHRHSPPRRQSPLATTTGLAASTSAGYTAVGIPTVSAAATPMAIPRAPENVPPPLPPPPFIPEIANGHDPGWQWGNDPTGTDFGRPVAVKPGSSLLGGGNMMRSYGYEKEHDHISFSSFSVAAAAAAASSSSSSSASSFAADARRASSISTIVPTHDHDMTDDSLSLTHSDEENASSRRQSNYRLDGERLLGRKVLEASNNTYDKQLLSRIECYNGPHTPKRPSVSYPSSGGLQETAQLAQAESERRNGAQQQLAMPERRSTVLESPASSRWPSSGPMSPTFAATFWPAEHGPSADATRAHTRRGSLAFEENSSHRGSYDHSMFMPDDFVEEGPMRDLNLHDRSPGLDEYARAGTKRRRSSPPRDASRDERSSVSSASGQSDMFQQRRPVQHMPGHRSSPVHKFQPVLSSLSSTSSYGMRHGSLGSSLGVSSIPSSATSYGSGRLSPSALSPAIELDNRPAATAAAAAAAAPYAASKVLNPALPATSGAAAHHQRNSSESTQPSAQSVPSAPESAQHSRNSSMSHMQGIFICGCCPKKPKKFDSANELRHHESEKQYTCAYCSNRFKNKNEAERHQNSLHLRRHSWSCAALPGVEAAFHPSPQAEDADVCGYCGERFANPPQWDVRAEHLNHVHKFGECKPDKKFFRADHFRQHLKHSHAGSSGKWTNMLETACMREEPTPDEAISPAVASMGADGSDAASSTGPPMVHQARPDVIAETQHDTSP